MKKNILIWLLGVLGLAFIMESVYFLKSMLKYKEQIESIWPEIDNKIKQRMILIEDIKKKSDLKINLYKNKNFVDKIIRINHSYNGRVLFMFLPRNACLDCMKDQVEIILKYIKQNENLSLVLLCRPVDYRENQLYKFSDLNIEIISVEESISIDSGRPFIFKLGVNKIDDLFFINKNFKDFTESSMIAITSDF